jgi:two-component system response regulator YesN
MKELTELYSILLVDDEPYVREGLKGLIDWGKYGFFISGEAEDGVTALEMIADLRPQLVITDVRMPEMDGLELIEKSLSELKFKGEYIILSGYGDFTYAQTAIKSGVKRYILKPIDEDELTGVLTDIYNELKSDAERDNEMKRSIQLKAGDVIRKLIKGEVNKDIGCFSANWLGLGTGQMLMMIIEAIDIRQWLLVMESEEIQSNMADIHSLILTAIGQVNSLCLLEVDASSFYLLVNQDMLKRFGNDEISFGHYLHYTISSSGYNTAIYVGKKVDDIQLLEDSYESCICTQERNFFERECRIVFYEKIKDKSFTYNVSDDEAYGNLLNAIELGRKDCIITLIDEFFGSLQKQYSAPEIAKTRIVSLLLDIVKSITEKNGDAEGLFSQINISSFELMTSHDLKRKLYGLCLSSMEYIRNLKEVNTLGVIADIERFVRRNYADDITLKCVAERFYVHPVYLGRQFKRKYCMYFNDYINNLRIEEAGRLLKKTDLKVMEIARKVGFSDPDYFIKKFKKIKGVSPTQFRGTR